MKCLRWLWISINEHGYEKAEPYICSLFGSPLLRQFMRTRVFPQPPWLNKNERLSVHARPSGRSSALLSRLGQWTTLTLWWRGDLGGADAKGWLVFSLLGQGVLIAVSIGLAVWVLAVFWAVRWLGKERLPRVPGYPGYVLGVVVVVLLSIA
ncbi:MAG: hypothetical protein U9Q82_11120 [Chloroflexota bacterium]|nr:hypothetical protein [Chloroflexota bacterium]